ncbi:MAG TPA: APC family permease [Thermoanaerobaculia bacterium]|nr:APC family permease [Thermoanaerobaculia bacterium]
MAHNLRRDLGGVESYAVLIGVLIGAGIFKVTGVAWEMTGPSVILGYLVLAPAILATSVAYSVFVSTPLGREPGGEYTHISRTFGGYGLAFVGAWLKIISYIGALAYLSRALGDYVRQLLGGKGDEMVIAVVSLVFFYAIHVAGVRWFGRIQVWMCVVLVVPGFFAVRMSNYRPFFTGGVGGFAASLPPLFFAYAGFESLAQTAGEVKDSTTQLPRVFLRGILATTIIYLLMSAVALGALPAAKLRGSTAPMADAASQYLPMGAAMLVTVGAIMAITTSLNGTMLVPSRLAIMLAGDGLSPRWLARVSLRTGTPIVGLTLTLAAALVLLVSGQISLALNIAVFALVVLYCIHSVALIRIPKALYEQVTVRIPRWLQLVAAWLSIASMGTLIVLQLRDRSLIVLVVVWSAIGVVLYVSSRIAHRGAAGRVENAEET